MEKVFRSSCPIASTLDLIGDKWSLLIVRDMLLRGNKTFKEFLSSPEKIAPGILSSRLKWLECLSLITKQKLPDNKKENIYLLTEMGIELTPLICEIILWSDKNVRALNPAMFPIADAGFVGEKSDVIQMIEGGYRELVQKTLDSNV